jgi:hypothetical protein
MYFTKNRVNLYQFVPIFTIFMFRPLQKNFFLTDQILKKKILQKTLLSCEKHINILIFLCKVQAFKFLIFISFQVRNEFGKFSIFDAPLEYLTSQADFNDFDDQNVVVFQIR